MSDTSMNHRTGLDRSQTLLFPERLEDYVAANNPVRFVDAFVGSLDLHALDFAGPNARPRAVRRITRRRCSSCISTDICTGSGRRGCWKRSVIGTWK